MCFCSYSMINPNAGAKKQINQLNDEERSSTDSTNNIGTYWDLTDKNWGDA